MPSPRVPLPLLLPFLLTACPDAGDPNKPQAAITSPASDASVSSTTPVQVNAVDDTGVAKVQVYARARGSTARGVQVGSAISKPFVIPWNTAGVPNLAELELYAVATDAGGNEGASDPVRVKTANTGLPSLLYLAAFTYPPQPATSVQSLSGLPGLNGPRLGFLDPNAVNAPVGVDLASARANAALALQRALESSSPRASASSLRPAALGDRTYALEWAWNPFTGADGYGIFLSRLDLAGPYDRQRNQASSAAGTQKFSRTITDATPGGKFFGAVTAITNNLTLETGYSNGDSAGFLPPQDSATPVDGATVTDGKPTLTWTGTPGAVGYLYFVYDKNPWDVSAQLKWTNSPNSTDKLAVTYPTGQTALPRGTYHWWVAGVSFDALGKAEGFTFSNPKQFIVP